MSQAVMKRPLDLSVVEYLLAYGAALGGPQ